MRRVLFRVGGAPIYSYPALLALGIVLGIQAELGAARAAGLDRRATLAATLILLVPAMLGARLLFLLGTGGLRRRRLVRALGRAQGGASMYGGLLLAAAASALVLPALGLPLGAFWDAATFALLVGMTVARVGCLLNGCCAGRPTRGPLGVWLRDLRGQRARRFPSQLLEAAWGCVLLAGAGLLSGRLPFAGGLFLCALGGYGAGRIVLEATRLEPDRLFGLPLQRLLSAALIVVSIGAFASWGVFHG
jgi:prolipoprotein diacylglyceryltransferase